MTHQPGVYVPLRALFLVVYAKKKTSSARLPQADICLCFQICKRQGFS